MDINEGCIDYNYRNADVEYEPSIIHKATQKNSENTRSESYSRVPNWIYDIDQKSLLDPNAFHGCECGQLVVTALSSYRDEKEHNYKAIKGFESLFPIGVLDGTELHDAMAYLVHDPLLPEHATRPRSQKIVQTCELHHTVTNNIFVLVDTSVDDINGRVSDPNGLLPAPGIEGVTYPSRFQTAVGFKDIPYEQRPPRCEHGHRHRSGCFRCFPQGHITDQCQECIEHRLALRVQHHDVKQLDIAHDAVVKTTQAKQQKVYLAHDVQARRAKALLANSRHTNGNRPGVPSPAPAARIPVGCERTPQAQSEFAFNPRFVAAVQYLGRI
jgi:hypothetical protein